MQISDIFSSKRQAIDKAKSTVLATMVVASIVVSFAIVTFNFLWDLRGYNSRLTAAKEGARDQLNENVTNAEALKNSFGIFEQGDVNSQEVLDALPSKYDFAAVITTMDSLAKRSGMLLTSFSGDDLSAEAVQTSIQPEAIEMPFSITVEGDYEDLQEFSETLQRSIRPFRVISMEISGNDENISADISMSTFYQPEASIDVEKETIQ